MAAQWVRHGKAPALAGLLYLAAVGSVAGLEHHSENQKIDRGAYTDTFDPAAFTQLVTLPGSAAVAGHLPVYPDRFDAPVYREVVRDRVLGFLGVGALQAPLCSVLVAAVTRHSARRRSPERSASGAGAAF